MAISAALSAAFTLSAPNNMLASKPMPASKSKLIQLSPQWRLAAILISYFILLFSAKTAWAQDEAAPEASQSSGTAELVDPQLDAQLNTQQALINVLDQVGVIGLQAEQIWLGEGEDQHLALYRPALNPAQMGVILLAESPQQWLHSPVIKQIYLDLPNHDWSTLSLFLPPPPTPMLPARSSNDKQKNAVDDATTSADNSTADEPNDTDSRASRRIN